MNCWPEMTKSASSFAILIDPYTQRRLMKFKPTFTLCSDQTYISRASYIYLVCSSSNFYWTRDIVLTRFSLWTPNDLWPLWQTIGIIFPLWGTYILILKFKQLSPLEISCLQGFQTLTAVDLKWPLTSMKNNRDHLPTKGYLPIKFEVQVNFTSSDIMFTKFSHFDLCWPQMTFDLHKNQ